MRPGRGWVLLLLLWGVGCAAPRTWQVRLEPDRATVRVFTSRSGPAPVELEAKAFRKTVSALARDVRPSSTPLEQARRLFGSPSRGDAAPQSPRASLGLVSLGTGEEVPHGFRLAEALPFEVELTRAYGRWCERKTTPGDCLLLLEGRLILDSDGRYALSMALALDRVWDETSEALKGMAHPEAVRATLVSAVSMYLMLWVLPEPVSKGLAATLTVALMAYLGIDTVWTLIDGWRVLVRSVDAATTFDEVREAGERYGRVMGRNAARIFVMLATAALGNTAGLAARAPTLPGAAPASLAAETELGVRYAALAEVRTVALGAEGVTVALAPGALAMTAQGASGGRAPGTQAVIPEGRVKHIFREAPGHLPDTPANRSLLQELAADASASLGTDRFGNTWFARVNPDGTQLWVQVRNGEVINGGLNLVPRNYNPQTGMSAPPPRP